MADCETVHHETRSRIETVSHFQGSGSFRPAFGNDVFDSGRNLIQMTSHRLSGNVTGHDCSATKIKLVVDNALMSQVVVKPHSGSGVSGTYYPVQHCAEVFVTGDKFAEIKGQLEAGTKIRITVTYETPGDAVTGFAYKRALVFKQDRDGGEATDAPP